MTAPLEFFILRGDPPIGDVFPVSGGQQLNIKVLIYMEQKRIVIMGAAGRDFHNFNTVYRGRTDVKVVAFTAAQIPDIDGRRYPAELAGEGYPDGIPILPEEDLTKVIRDEKIDEVVFSYSDIPYVRLMNKASMAMAAGVDFKLIGPNVSMIPSTKPLIAVTAIRTGCGKSQTTRRVAELLINSGKKVAAIRHPMPYGDLVRQKVQRFATIEDLTKHECTIEEMEEYEPHITSGIIIYAGVDYEAILRQAEEEADVILWDGGNNDLPFYKPDYHITVVDPLRPGHELAYYPGEVNLRMSDAVVINKIDSASQDDLDVVRENIAAVAPSAMVIDAASPVVVDKPEMIRGKRVLVVEDGPTLTHGEMKFGAGVVAARKFGAAQIVDPRPFLYGKLKETFEIYPEVGHILPAMGYGDEQVADLERTINASDVDVVIIGTPIDLRRVINVKKECVRVTYDLQEIGRPNLEDALSEYL
ncbi:MAG: cyclic 2,3-diphosphoglycerate synthase [Candidatus Electryoneaceae bacterium]|nr:cyclic 2,3-diphosphoglycerate synthase [Candidatus Electryoneaceae bacterium]